jgi:hypothetical protein
MTLPYRTRIEYIESTDANPCRFTIENFNLDMALNSGNTIVVETENKYSEVFSSAKYEYIANFSGLFYSMTSGTGYFGLGGSTVFDNYIAINPTKYQKLRLEFTATTESDLYVDDVLAAHRISGLSYGTVSKFYFMWGRGDNQFNFAHKKKYIKIWYNGVLTYYFVPVLDNNNVPCFYDEVSKTLLYADEGYTPVHYGPEITEYKTRVESISSTSTYPCRFTIKDLDIKTTDSWTFETDIRWLSHPDALNIELNANLSGNWFGTTAAGIYTITPASTTRCSEDTFDNIRFAVNGSNTTLYVNGTSAVDKTNQRGAITELPIYWAKFGNTYYATFVERKYFKLSVNGTVIRNYIPVLDWTDTPCFYDTINKELLYADSGYEPKVYGGIVIETPSTYQRLKQLLIADKGILPYYCELEYISYPTKFLYAINSDVGATATSVIEIETEIKYLGSLGGGVQLEGNGSAGRWYGINAEGNYTLGGGVISTTPASTTKFDKIRDIQDCNNAVNTLYVNGVQLLQRTSMNTGFPITMAMFTDGSGASYQFNVAKKYHKVWVDGKLVYDWIPVLDYKRVPCWYNRVNGAFLYAYSGDTPTVWGREIHPIERCFNNKDCYVTITDLEPTDTIQMKCMVTDDTTTSTFWVGTTSGQTTQALLLNANKAVTYRWFNTNYQWQSNFANQNEILNIEFNKYHLKINNNETTNIGTDVTTVDDFRLLRGTTAGTSFTGWFYNWKLYDFQMSLKRNIIPVVDETGVCFLWDTVQRFAYTTQGATLTYDDIILESVENKVITDGDVGGPYISLPYEANNNTQIACRFNIKNTSYGRYMYGNTQYRMSHSASTFSITYGPGYYKSIVTNPINVIRVKRDSTKNYFNDVEVESNDERNPFTTTSFSIFTQGSSNNGMVGPYNYFQIGENNQLLYDLVPTIRNGVIGMVNSVDGVMYPNLRAGVDFYPNFYPQRKMFNALENVSYWEWEIDTTLLDANNKTFGFYQNTPNFDIDWGDGNYESGTTSHTYAAAGKYTIRIYKTGNLGRFYWYDSSTPNQYGVCITALNTPMPLINQPDLSQCFRGCTNLTKVCDNFFVNNRHATYVNYFFYECPLTYIPKNILKGMYVLGSVTGLFAKTNVSEVPVDLFNDVKTNCTITACFSVTKIKTLPAHLLDRLVDCVNASQFVNQCAELEYLPDLFFQYQTKVTNWRYLAYGATNFRPNANLFCDEATDMATRFNGLSGLDFTGAFSRTAYTGTGQGTAPQLWNYTYSDPPTTTGCYSGAGNNATSLTNYASIPSAWGGPA